MSYLSNCRWVIDYESVIRLDEMINTTYQLQFTSSELLNLVGLDIVLHVGGLPISILNLAKSGWSCKITHNRYGGRSRISFTSQDNRSIIAFRIAGSYRRLDPIQLFEFISQESCGTWTANTRPIPAAATDLELLGQVNKNINRRLTAHRK